MQPQEGYGSAVNDLLESIRLSISEEKPSDPVAFIAQKLKSAVFQVKCDAIPASYPPELGQKALTIVVLGASGDLAKKKTFPALFALFSHGLLPPHVNIVGYARTPMEAKDLRERLLAFLPAKAQPCHKDRFLQRITYFRGEYNSLDDFAGLNKHIEDLETKGKGPGNRVFYFALPPTAFVDVAKCVHEKAMPTAGWGRVVIEKPFGSDTESSNRLSAELRPLFREEQVFRIDHYLGKEMVQNLVTLRFANHVFGTVWNNRHISNVQITFKEKIGTEGRGGYFDQFGIIRDVIQNHLTQILALLAMEKPRTLNAEDIRDEKVAVLRCCLPVKLEECVLGQYGPSADGKEKGYLDDPTVPKGSNTPTFASMVVHINNDRWAGVPFIVKAGKALDAKVVLVRIQFRDEIRPFLDRTQRNELVIRAQPDEAMYLKITSKSPGMNNNLQQTELDLSYKHRYENVVLGDAYESLINEVILGNSTNFVRSDELEAAWNIYTPLLHRIAQEKIPLVTYPFGSRGPAEADDLACKMGYKRTTGYEWSTAHKEGKAAAATHS